MMRIKTKISIVLLVFFVIGCSKKEDDAPVIVPSSEKQLIDFTFNIADNTGLAVNLSATIDQGDKTMRVGASLGDDVTELTPSISISEKATVTPIGPQNFSAPVTYTVTAEDGSTANYVATVIVNSAPLSFELVVVLDNETNVDVLPVFSWNATSDPDGDPIVYDLYLNEGATPSQLYAGNLTENSFEVSERLELTNDYSWKVVAKDPKGATTSSADRNFTTRALRFNDSAETENAEFTKREFTSSLVFQDRIWVIGGQTSGGNGLKDVWSSADGSTWELANEGAEFSTRFGHSTVVFDNLMWLIGGIDADSKKKNDVWVSEDGVVWKEAVKEAPFSGRAGHTSVVFDNKIWVIGGLDENNERENDIWVSKDGFNWEIVTKDAPFGERVFHTTVVFGEAMYLIGGEVGFNTKEDDVWRSSNGFDWEVVTKDAPFTARMQHSAIAFDNKMWIIGGNDENGDRKNDVWSSMDGVNWIEETAAAPFSRRSRHTSVAFDNKAFVIAGTNEFNIIKNDVWTFE